MIKKLFFWVLTLLPLVASAQLGAGQWIQHPYYVGAGSTNAIDTGDKIYYLSGKSLFCFDKSSETNEVLDKSGKLNDVNIRQIYFNYEKNYLLLAYDNGNIDVIDSEGAVTNVPVIKEMVLSRARTINDVKFTDDNRIFISTAFGLVVLDATSFGVLETRDYNIGLQSTAIVGETKVISLNTTFYYGGKNEEKEAVHWFKSAANSAGAGTIYPINDSKFFFKTSNRFYSVQINRGTNAAGQDTCSFVMTQLVAAAPVTVQPTPSGFVASFGTANYYYTYDANGGSAKKVTGNELYTTREDGNWWVVGANGLAHIVNGVKGTYIKPSGISISANAYWMEYDPMMKRIILSRTTDNQILPTANTGAKTEINSYDGTQWLNITPAGAPNNSGNYWPVVSPNEIDTYFYSCRTTSGVVKVQNNAVVAQYTYANSPLSNRGVSLRFDSKGNLWMPQTRYTDIDVVCLPRENQTLTQVDSSKFIINDLGGNCASSGFKRITFDIGAEDTKVFTAGDYDSPLIIWQNNDDLSVKRYKVLRILNDQDNKDFWSYSFINIKADKEGMIWIGSKDGIISFDPTQAFNDDFKINRIKTKRAGSDLTETLLEGIQVNCIGVDAQNRKWLATNNSGVYFVSADGSEILLHFDSTNSPLPCDQVYTVCCNENTGSVMIVTPQGVLEYFDGVTPAEKDYSNVYAFPNPVQPDFTGWITIKGLMAGSNVVITNAEGATVATLTSNGGIATWDGCDATGNRLPTGMYNVYASQGTTSTSGQPLTRVAIIK